MTSQYAGKLRDAKFGKQFVGLTLKDFEQYDVVSGKASGKVEAIKNPAPEAEADFRAALRATKKNLILMDEFVYSQATRRSSKMITKFQVAYKNLLRKKVRSLLTLVGIALSAWVLVSLLGFNHGYETSLNKDIDNMGFQLMIMAKGCPYEAATLMLKGGTGLRYMKESIEQDVAKEPEVDKITPILMSAVFDPNKGESGGIAGYFGVEAKSFATMKPFLKFKQGGWFTDENAYEAVMGFEAAELEQREVGDMILMPEKNVQFKVVGILERTGTQDDGTIFVPLKTLQKIFNRPDEITTIGIKLKKGVDSTRLEEKLYQLPDVQIVSLAQVKETIMKLISTAKVMVLSIALIAILIAMVGVINTILTSVWERFQEIGILKTIGAMPWDIFKLIWTETLMLCMTGASPGNHPGADSLQADGCGHAPCPALRPGRRTRADRLETDSDHPGRDHVHRSCQRHLSGLEGREDQAAGGDQRGGRPMNRTALSIETKNLTKIYPRGIEEIHSVNEVSLRIDKGDFVSIIGPSGSGKTTLDQSSGLPRQSDFRRTFPRGPIDLRQRKAPFGTGVDENQKGDLRLYLSEFLSHPHPDRPGKRAAAAHVLPQARHRERGGQAPEAPGDRPPEGPPPRPDLGR